MIRARAILVLISMVALLGACGEDKQDSGTTKVTIATGGKAAANLVLYVADSKGFLAKEGITADIPSLKSGADVMTALASGSADFATNGSDAFLQLASQRDDLKILMTEQSRIVQQLVVSKSWKAAGIDKPYPDNVRALKGARVGVSGIGASIDLNLRYLASQAGLDPAKDLNILAVGTGDTMIAALKAGQVDAIHTYEPVRSLVVDELGLATMLVDLAAGQGPPIYQNFPYQVIGTTAKYTAAHPDTVQKVVRAMVAAEQWMKDPKNFDAVLTVAKDNFGAGLSAAVLDGLVHTQIGLAEPGITVEGMTNVSAVLISNGTIDKMPSLDKLLDLSFLQKATG